MCDYIGLDVSQKETTISVRREGRRVWHGKCPSDPQANAMGLQRREPDAKRVLFETGPLSVWFYDALSAEGLPAIYIDARHAKAALDMAPNKTDANDANGLAHLAEIGVYREVRVKCYDSMLVRTLVAARRRLVRVLTELSNQIRNLMKTFGLIVPREKVGRLEVEVRRLLNGYAGLAQVLLALLEAWLSVRARAAELGSQLCALPDTGMPTSNRGATSIACGHSTEVWVIIRKALTCHGIFPSSVHRVWPMERADDEEGTTDGRADHWHPAGARSGREVRRLSGLKFRLQPGSVARNG